MGGVECTELSKSVVQGLQEKSESDEKKKERESFGFVPIVRVSIPPSISLNISPHCLKTILLTY
jgi:hypothetical protein